MLYTLYEHAAGYAVFKVVAQEEIGVLLPEVQESVADLARFGKLVKLHSFAPFKSGANALDNINCISEGVWCFCIESRRIVFDHCNFMSTLLLKILLFLCFHPRGRERIDELFCELTGRSSCDSWE